MVNGWARNKKANGGESASRALSGGAGAAVQQAA